MDRAYIDFSRLHVLTQCSAFFVIRAKTNLQFRRLYSHHIDKSTGLRCDQTIVLTGINSSKEYPDKLRRVRYFDSDNNLHLTFLTNNFMLPSETIAALYKARWEIELFFKWIKQNLKVKSFYGTSPNAVKTQIWIAMIVYLVLAILKERYRLENSMSQLLHFLEVNLFECKFLISIFESNPRKVHVQDRLEDKQLKLFDF